MTIYTDRVCAIEVAPSGRAPIIAGNLTRRGLLEDFELWYSLERQFSGVYRARGPRGAGEVVMRRGRVHAVRMLLDAGEHGETITQGYLGALSMLRQISGDTTP